MAEKQTCEIPPFPALAGWAFASEEPGFPLWVRTIESASCAVILPSRCGQRPRVWMHLCVHVCLCEVFITRTKHRGQPVCSLPGRGRVGLRTSQETKHEPISEGRKNISINSNIGVQAGSKSYNYYRGQLIIMEGESLLEYYYQQQVQCRAVVCLKTQNKINKL